eukprot:gene22910-20808_t
MINSMRMERLQYNQLCMQKIANVFRKNAFTKLMAEHETFTIKTGMRPTGDAANALQIFREPIEFTLSETVPRERMFDEVLEEMVQQMERTLPGGRAAGSERIDAVLERVRVENARHQQNHDTEMVQEQEEEKEQEQEKEEEKEVEVEKYVDLVYSRDSEDPVPWPVASLGSMGSATAAVDDKPAPLYPMTGFRLYRRRPLHFPDSLMATRNFFDLRWGGERRLKNVIVSCEWVPDARSLRDRPRPSRDYGEVAAGDTVEQVCALIRGAGGAGAVGEGSLRDLFRIALRRPVDAGELRAELAPAAGSVVPDIEEEDVMRQVGATSRSHHDAAPVFADALADHAAAAAALAGNALRHEEDGRYCVAVALCEAEALRRVVHVRSRTRDRASGRVVAALPSLHLQLRCVPAGGAVIDASDGFPPEPPAGVGYQHKRQQACLRFFDGELQYSDEQQSLLLRAVHCSVPMHRYVFFDQVRGCRRRGAADRWEQTPLAAVVKLRSGYDLLRQLSVGAAALRRAAMDAEGVVDFLDAADGEGKGTLSYPDFLHALTGDRE